MPATSAGNAPSGPGYEAWLASKGFGAPFGFAIDVTDSGLDRDTVLVHPDLLGRVGYAHDYTLDPDATDCGGHGTNVASIAAGLGTPPARTPRATSTASAWRPTRRSAPRRSSAATARPPRSTTRPSTADAYAGGARISNNSWGISNFGGYHAASQAYDALVRDASSGTPGNQEMVEVFSAGNDGDGKGNPLDPKGDEGYGSITAPGTAKNVITVGAAESVRGSGTDGCGVTNGGADSAGDIINFSGRGPTQDGRMKPDLVAPGTHITGASPQHAGYTGASVCDKNFGGSSFYSLVSGTSQAAPHVAGAAALLRDWYVRGGVDPQPPSPAITKAMLVNTRRGHRRRRQRQGQPDPVGAEHRRGLGPREPRRRPRRDPARVPRPGGTTLDATGQSVLRSYAVADAGEAGARDARLDRPAARHRHRQRLRERPRPRGERRRPHLPRQLAGGRRVDPRRPGRLPQQRRERGAPGEHRAGGCR